VMKDVGDGGDGGGDGDDVNFSSDIIESGVGDKILTYGSATLCKEKQSVNGDSIGVPVGE